MATEQMSPGGMSRPAGDASATTRVQQQVQEKASDMKGQAAEKARQQIDTRTTDLGGQIQSLAQALRRSAEQLDGEGNAAPAGMARKAAGQVERLGGYLKDSSSDRFLGDVEAFARNRPWAAGGIGALLGLAASRFLKASSGERHAQRSAGRDDLDSPLSRDGDGYAPGAPALPVGGPHV